jgi:DNA-binding response OmpR family regulator
MDSRILLLEDEAHLARGLSFNLEAEGYAVEHFQRGEDALERLTGDGDPPVDLAVLDVMLPGISGLEVLRRLREQESAMPVQGLDMGADDYLTKPFSLPVLLARVRTLLRRSREADSESTPASFAIGACTVHPDSFEIEKDGERAQLTAKERDLLLLLWSRRGNAVSRGEILQEVWDLHPETRTRVVDTFVLRLRKLIEPDPSEPRFLLSVRSFGYRLVEEPAG